MGHIGEKALRALLKETGVNHPIGILKDNFKLYKLYLQAKFTNKVRKRLRNHTREYDHLKKVTSDMYRPISPPTYDRYRYFVTFLDKATWDLEVKLLRTKDKVYKAFIEFKNKAENNPSNKRIRLYTIDGGGKFVNKRFQDLFTKEGITYQVALPYTKEPNGLIERPNRTL